MDKKELEKQIQNIVKNKLPVFFISPHPDDVMLSCGDLVAYLAKKTKVTVITVFTDSSNTLSLSAKKFLQQCGHKDQKSLFAQRRKEDIEAFSTLGVEVIHLGFVEALFRQNSSGSFIRKFLGKFIPEAKLVYPTYQVHIKRGKVAKDDEILITKIGNRLSEIMSKDSVVFAPLGIGGHIDHTVTKLAVKKICRPFYYFDQPYYYRKENTEVKNYPYIFEKTNMSEEKKKGINYYKTQINGLFRNSTIPTLIERYIASDILTNQFPIYLHGYYFIEELVKLNSKKTYRYGLYRNNSGKLGFAKVWNGRIKGRGYYFLKNEINAIKFLESLHVKQKEVTFPKIIDTFEGKTSLVMLSEFKEGASAQPLSNEQKVKVFSKTFEFLAEVNKTVNIKSRKILHRGMNYLLATLPFIIVILIIRRPRTLPLILKTAGYITFNIPIMLKNNTYGFVHKDIGEKNILVNDQITLHDFQLSCIANPIVDYVIMYLKAHHVKGLKELVFEKIITKHFTTPADLRLFYSYTCYFALYEASMLNNKEYPVVKEFIEDIFGKIQLFENKKVKQKENKTQRITKRELYMRIVPIGIISVGILLLALVFSSYIKGLPKDNGLYYQSELDTRVGGPYEASSSTSRYALVIAMATNHAFTLPQQLAKFAAPDVTYYHGKFFTLFTPGISFLGLPFYLLGSLIGIPQISTYLLTALLACANIAILTILLKKITNSAFAGLIAGFVFIFATNALPYSFTFTQHIASTLLLLLSFTLCLAKRNIWTNILFGLVYGLGLLIDIPNGILFFPCLLYVLYQNTSISTSEQKTQFSFKLSVIGLLIGIIPMLMIFGFYNYKTTASYTKIAQFIGGTADFSAATQDKIVVPVEPKNPPGTLPPIGINFVFKTRTQLEGLYTLLISKERAWWYYSPVLLFGLLGLYSLYRSRTTRAISILLFSIVLVNILLYSMFGDPWGGWAFGPRYLIPAAGILCLGVGAALAKYAKNIVFSLLFIALLVYSIWVNTIGALTTTAIPPEQTAMSLATHIPYTYAYNLQLINSNVSGSLLYNSIIYHWMNVRTFSLLLVILTSLVFITFYIMLINQKGESK